jgi:ATP-binding cassette subfamily B protein
LVPRLRFTGALPSSATEGHMVRELTGRHVITQAVRTSWAADRTGTLVAGAMQAVGALSALGVVLASKLALDAVLGGSAGITTGLVLALVLLALTTALSTSVGVLQQQQQRLLGEKLGQHVWRSLVRSCVSVDLVTWNSADFVDRLDRVRGNALQRPTVVVTSLLSLMGSVFGVVSMVVVLLALQPLLIPVLLAAGVPAVVFSRMASRAEFAFVTASNRAVRRRLYLKQLLTGRVFAAEVRAFDSGPHLLGRHGEEDGAYLADLRRHVRRRQVLGVLSTGSSAVALAIALLLIVVLVDRGSMSLAEAGAAAIATRLLGGQLTTVFSSVGTLIESGPFLADMQSFLDDSPAVEPRGRGRALTDQLRLDDVRFGYEGRAAAAVDGVSIVIPAGRVVAVVGENGSGKTTLAKIVAGLYAPQEGSLSWDGDTSLPLRDLRAGVSVLFQDFVRYQMSGRENISIADTGREVDEEQVAAAARRVGIDDALRSLADGYDTVLGLELSEGSDLSGGQWQRLALARAFYRDAPVVVLDEPTAAMDPRAEHELFSDVRHVLDGRAALLISHRYSSVQLADYIYVMAAGRVVEEGTHEQLLALGGQYAELYTLQAAAYLS